MFEQLWLILHSNQAEILKFCVGFCSIDLNLNDAFHQPAEVQCAHRFLGLKCRSNLCCKLKNVIEQGKMQHPHSTCSWLALAINDNNDKKLVTEIHNTEYIRG